MLKKFWIVTNDGKDTNHAVTEKVKELLEIAGRICILCEKDAEKNKVMKINEQWEALKEESHANIQSEKGILNRQIRSIQTEGHFGDIKENDGFRRFNYRTAEKVYKEFMLYAIGRNINKYHRFLHDKIKKFEGKSEEKAA